MYPPPEERNLAAEELYKRSHKSYAAGEQVMHHRLAYHSCVNTSTDGRVIAHYRQNLAVVTDV